MPAFRLILRVIINYLTCTGCAETEQDISAPPFQRHATPPSRLGAERFGAGTSWRWDISTADVTAPDVSARALYAAAASTLHSGT